MSWMKGAQGGAPPTGPERQPYGAPQPYGNQQSMYNNYQSSPANVQQQQQPQMWQVPQQPPQYNQQYGQAYQQPHGFNNNANQFYQQQPGQFNQNYSNVPQGYQQNYYTNQVAPQQNYTQNKANADGWEDNWDWGWDDTSKQTQKSQNQTVPVQTMSHQQVFNNANVIEESFGTTDSWNWSMEDKSETRDKPSGYVAQSSDVIPSSTIFRNNTTVENPIADNNTGSDGSSQRNISNLSSQHPSEEVRNLSERDVVKERLPNLALGKRFHLENLTPQWSIESQMSQESSDGPQTHSEGTYRSENQSRNSSKSSPGLNTDNSNFNYSQAGYDDFVGSQTIDWSKKSDEPSVMNNVQDAQQGENHDELLNSMQDMSISNNEITNSNQVIKEPPSHPAGSENLPVDFHSRTSHSPVNLNVSEIQIPPGISPGQLVPSKALPLPPVTSTPQHPPANFVPACSSAALPVLTSNPSSSVLAPPSNNFHGNTSVSGPPSFPPSSTSSILPPANFPSSQNPFKHAGPFSHKNVPKGPVGNIPAQPFSSQLVNNNLTSPAVVNKLSQQQNRVPVGFGANLETTPDNSERPDQPQVSSYRPIPVSQQIPDNLEIAPQNDRNEYLQTAHLSSGDYGENTDFSRDVPLSSLRRMGVGQQDSEYAQNLNISGDEPPPGLARMVPGQQTEADHGFNQPNDTYMDRQIDGQPTDTNRRPYRQAEGQHTPDNYTQPPTSRATERRPIGLDRMVPGEPSNDEFLQYQNPNYSTSNDQRVVTGVDHAYSLPTEVSHSDIREQNVDGSDYSEQNIRNSSRDIMGVREANDASPDYSAPLEEQQREVTMEGENLQDLSAISSTDVSYARDSTFDGANVNAPDPSKDRNHDEDESVECHANNSTRQSLNGGTTGEDSDRDRTYKSSPRRDRDKRKSSRDHDRDKDRDRARDRDKDKEGRYSRSDRERKYERDPDRRSAKDDRRSDKDRKDRDRDKDRDRRDRGDSPDSRRYRRRGHRYETEDTDYYSDKERERRRYREGSLYKSSKPPRPEDKERERSRRYTVDRDERDGRRRERYTYRDIDTSRKHANQRATRERDEERRRVVTFSGDAKPGSSNAQGESYSSPSRAGSREATATDEELPEERRRAERDERRRARSHRPDPYYDSYDPYALQRRQYEYYERLRRADPAAYMRLYKQLMAGHAPNIYNEGYGAMGYEAGARGEERASVHSGRSSANGLKGNDTCGGWRPLSVLGATDLLTDGSDRELTTDASLNLHLEESTVRSERMTPFKYSTSHIKGRLSARALVCVRAAYPVDGLPATVQLLPLASLLAHEPAAAELHAYPGPLVKGVTHKKSVLEYCEARARGAVRGGGVDPRGAALLWRLLALLLRQNGVVMGTDIAELLMKNTREDEYRPPPLAKLAESRRESSVSGSARPDAASSPDAPSLSAVESIPQDEESAPGGARSAGGAGEREAVDRLREYLLYGNRQEALEWAMSAGLWGHALTLAAHGGRRARAAVTARFLAALSPADPLHTLYAALGAQQPPAATCVADERWGDWRPHAAIVLSNTSAKPEQDRRTLTQLGDTLSSRGLIFSAQFCYLSAGVPLESHPLEPLMPPGGPVTTPPRLSLLLADPRATTLQQFATNQAIFATEIYEYALSLSQDYVINELQAYKLVLATRLVDAGLCERALRYTEQIARALTRAPYSFTHQIVVRLASLADRLKYFDPTLQDEGEGGEPGEAEGGEEGGSEPSPRHQQWLADVTRLAHTHSIEASTHTTPHHQPDQQLAYAAQQQQQQQQQQYSGWGDQTLQQYQTTEQQYQHLEQQFLEPAEEAPDCAPHYYSPPAPPAAEPPALPAPEETHAAPQQHQYDYWQPDPLYGYNEQSAGSVSEDAVPSITMPGAPSRRTAAAYQDYDDDRPPSTTQERETDTPQSDSRQEKSAGQAGAGAARRGGWLGGFLTKLVRPPNQMILPDDKNPTIVWDEQHKRWRNTAGDGDDEPAPPPRPPPTMPALTTSTPLNSPAMGAPPPSVPGSNMYKMQKSRHIKKSYVDVLNPGGAVPGPAPAPALLPAAPAPAPPAFFVPPPSLIHVSIPTTPEDSPLPTPISHSSLKDGIYDPMQMADDEVYRSGI